MKKHRKAVLLLQVHMHARMRGCTGRRELDWYDRPREAVAQTIIGLDEKLGRKIKE